MKISFALPALLAVVACAPAQGIMQNYGDTKPVAFTSDGTNYRVYDQPAENRLMITPTIGGSLAAGMAKGATLGLGSDGIDPNAGMKTAAQQFAAAKGCTITAGRKLMHPQYEFDYTC
ncbi:hypothetical protein [Paracoccus sp. SM22M-07]|uniref:hypothetical protein n=1 Tax=Paracoccus sp. SM22M-07 TaxID=1520813 RepID=UPI00091229C1|nr:hypothetical protein [Paracoccus sp. SM22M-07]OJH46172.1 hypothetical protein IE00_02895 [Paracoccus sp. SM22M-07]